MRILLPGHQASQGREGREIGPGMGNKSTKSSPGDIIQTRPYLLILAKEFHQLKTKHSNTEASWRLFSFKPPQAPIQNHHNIWPNQEYVIVHVYYYNVSFTICLKTGSRTQGEMEIACEEDAWSALHS